MTSKGSEPIMIFPDEWDPHYAEIDRRNRRTDRISATMTICLFWLLVGALTWNALSQ